jgi:hypothetical protein
MKQKQNFIILGAIGLIFLLFWYVVLTLIIKNLRGSSNESDPIVINVTLCDADASNLCIVTFGANNLNRMVIHFQLPNAGYAPFYVKATNRGTVSVYTCEVDQATPTRVYCTGVRTPLGETIDIDVYTTDQDKLIARGTFLVSAIALSTPISLPSETPTVFPTLDQYIPTEETPTTFPTLNEFSPPTENELTQTPTSTPNAGAPTP